MNKSYVAHKEYVRGIVREIYPAANLDEDFFLILQPILQRNCEKIDTQKYDESCCMVNVYQTHKNKQTNIYTTEMHPFQNRRVAIAGSRYGSVRVAKNRFQSEDFEKQLLYVEGGKQVSDIGIVIRVENFEELQLLESIEIIWDYDMATTTLLYVPTFMLPKRKSNCYLLKAEIRDELEESRLEIGETRIIRNNGNTQISLRERQTNGKDHFIHYITTELSASPLGENIRIAGASKKYMKWQKRRLKEE